MHLGNLFLVFSKARKIYLKDSEQATPLVTMFRVNNGKGQTRYVLYSTLTPTNSYCNAHVHVYPYMYPRLQC